MKKGIDMTAARLDAAEQCSTGLVPGQVQRPAGRCGNLRYPILLAAGQVERIGKYFSHMHHRDQGLIEPGRRFVLVKDPRGLSMAVSASVRGTGFGSLD